MKLPWKEDEQYNIEQWAKWKQTLFWVLAYTHLGIDLVKGHRENNPDQPQRNWLVNAYTNMTTEDLRKRNHIH